MNSDTASRPDVSLSAILETYFPFLVPPPEDNGSPPPPPGFMKADSAAGRR
jgi:hypothetical protein